MLEIELKFSVASHDLIRQRIEELWQSTNLGIRFESDHYFNAPDRDFAKTGEAFRIRVVDSQATLTYKGPKLPGDVKTRKEIEVPLEAGAENLEAMRGMLIALGYRPVAVVRKKREIIEVLRDSQRLLVCLDEVDRLGCFVELETMAEESSRDAAEALIRQAASELELVNRETRSYLRLFLESA